MMEGVELRPLRLTRDEPRFAWNGHLIIPGDMLTVVKQDGDLSVTTMVTGQVRYAVPFNGFYKALCLGKDSLRSLLSQGYTLVAHHEVGR